MTREEKLARNICHNAIKVAEGNNVLIEHVDVPSNIICELIKAVTKLGGNAYVNCFDSKITKYLRKYNKVSSWGLRSDMDLEFMKKMDCYVIIRNQNNPYVMNDVESSVLRDVAKILRPVIDYRVSEIRWCVLEWPSDASAQKAKMSTEEYEELFFNVCNVDYCQLGKDALHLKDLMEKTDIVRIVSKGTDITFSIKGIPAVVCAGQYNIPDGEVFTAPIRDSVNGHIQFNTPTEYMGKNFNNIYLEVVNGKIVSERSDSNNLGLTSILNTDEGSRFFGEFAIGINPMLDKALGSTLFDEKITGSIHLTPGKCYDEANNGNVSAIHWDLVLVQNEGQIYFDGVLVREDGYFVLDSLKCLNPIF